MGATDKFTVVLETVGLNATKFSAYCRERGLFPEQVDRWRQTAHFIADHGGAAGSRVVLRPRPEGNQTAAKRTAVQGQGLGGEQRPIEWCNSEGRYP